MIVTFFNVSILLSILIGFAFVVQTSLSSSRGKKEIFYLNLFVLFFTFHNIQIVFADEGYLLLPLFERKLLLPFYALVIPCFYTFVTYYLKVKDQIQSFIKLSVVLFVVQIFVRLIIFLFLYDIKHALLIAQYMQVEEIVNLSFTLFLFLKIVYIFFRQAKLIDVVLSFDNLQWLKNFLWFGFAVIILWITAVVFNINKTMNPNLSVYYPLRLSTALLIIWIAYNGFFKLQLITERVQLRQLISDVVSKRHFRNINSDVIFQKIESHFDISKTYLNVNYCLTDLSKELSVTEATISKALSNAGHKGFIEYLNKKRIETAKEILKDTTYHNYTMVAIGFECGFSSKSSFYREFAKQTKTTPTLFRKSES